MLGLADWQGVAEAPLTAVADGLADALVDGFGVAVGVAVADPLAEAEGVAAGEQMLGATGGASSV